MTLCFGQQQTADLKQTSAGEIIPTVTFTRNWQASQPQFFKVEVESSGRAVYTSQSAEKEEPYTFRFTMSQPTRDKIFALAEAANYFNGSFDYTQHRVAQTGIKTLSYHDASHNSQTTYNWSQNKAVDELTKVFTGISNTLEAGRQLDYLMQHDRLGLNHQLEGMEHEADSGELSEIQLIAPELQQIASDATYMHIAQERARRLLHVSK